MSDRWVLDEDYPEGHLVPMTPDEQEQCNADQAAGAAAAAAQATLRENQAAITAAITSRMATLRDARTALAGGAIFASLSAGEKSVLDSLLQDDLQLARLALGLFDATDSAAPA